jgi:putative hydrolase of the HAD superfamily
MWLRGIMVVIKAVLFDLGGTLIKTDSVSIILKRILTKHGIQVQVNIDETDFDEIAKEMSRDYGLPYRKFWRIYNVKLLKKVGLGENLEKLADSITDEWWDNVGLELYPEVKDTLLMLRRQGLKLGIVTNGFRKDIDDILSRVGLAEQFDVTVGVDDVGKPKPEKKMFLYALEKMAVKPHEALFVGDTLDADYKGAEGAGLKPLLIDRDEKVCDDFTKIHDLKEVVQYL